MAVCGDWVKIKKIVLNEDERAENIPDDTKKTPLTMWVKGLLMQDAQIGDYVKIQTLTGRIVEGILTEVNPRYTHNFGDTIPELVYIGINARKILYGGENNEQI